METPSTRNHIGSLDARRRSSATFARTAGGATAGSSRVTSAGGARLEDPRLAQLVEIAAHIALELGA